MQFFENYLRNLQRLLCLKRAAKRLGVQPAALHHNYNQLPWTLELDLKPGIRAYPFAVDVEYPWDWNHAQCNETE